MQGGSTGIGYGLKYQARCIADVKADTETTTFIAGTLSLKEENEVHLIRLSSSETELICEGLFSHPNEIWDLSSCPYDPRIFSTVFSSGESYGAAIWKIPELYGQSNSPQLEQLASLDGHTSKIKRILWWPSGTHDKVISIDEENLLLWSLDSSNKTAQVQSRESVGMLHNFSGGAWDPHDRNAVAVTCDSSIQFWDLRTMKKTNTIEHAHVRDVDYSIKKQNILVSAEDETGICIWDIRMPKMPIRELPGHAHWTWAVRSNPEYDDLILDRIFAEVWEHQLVLLAESVSVGPPCFCTTSILRQSAGTDSAVNLWLASIPGNGDSMNESPVDSPTRRVVDPLLNSYSDYEDSVYGLTWSSRQPWIFASLSYDGRVVVESVKQYLPKK